METVAVDVAPRFETNFRVKLHASLQPKRILTLVLAMGFLGYLAFTHPQAELRKMALLTLVVLLLLRFGVIALSSIVTERQRRRYTMNLTVSDETIILTNEAGPQDVGWEYLRRARVTKAGIVLELRSQMFVFVDFAKTTNARELIVLLKRHRLV
ncbi:MAG: hypothetical protein H7Z43_14190 [Clostridia bacterium]|nr:hypothetical protein [Deltaproteobacteria bacterium]